MRKNLSGGFWIVSGEHFAAVVDPNLSDVSVTSTTETETESASGSESGLDLSFGAALASFVCLAVLCLGHVLGDEQLIHFYQVPKSSPTKNRILRPTN